MKPKDDLLEAEIATAILSTFKKDLSLDKNKSRSQLLETMMWRAGYASNKVFGYFINNENLKIEEETYFIIDASNNPHKLQRFAENCSRYFEQETIFFKIFNKNQILLTPNKKIKEFQAELSLEQISQFYSEIKDKTYAVENAKYLRSMEGFGGAVLRKKYSDLLQEDYTEFSKHCNELLLLSDYAINQKN